MVNSEVSNTMYYYDNNGNMTNTDKERFTDFALGLA
jgi:hypothetical protein